MAERKATPDVEAILDRIPAKSVEDAQQLGENLTAGGAELVRTLLARVGEEFGDSAGAKPKQALHGLVIYASRPGADGQRATVAKTLAAELDEDHSNEFKAFVLRQLQLCGREEEVPRLARQLDDERLCEPATQALLAIGGDDARAALRKALSGAQGGRKKTLSLAVDRLP